MDSPNRLASICSTSAADTSTVFQSSRMARQAQMSNVDVVDSAVPLISLDAARNVVPIVSPTMQPTAPSWVSASRATMRATDEATSKPPASCGFQSLEAGGCCGVCGHAANNRAMVAAIVIGRMLPPYKSNGACSTNGFTSCSSSADTYRSDQASIQSRNGRRDIPVPVAYSASKCRITSDTKAHQAATTWSVSAEPEDTDNNRACSS